DTHVHRISNRRGGVKTSVPDETEQALYKATDRRWWPYINLYLVTWGQNVCRPVYPKCGECVVREQCARGGVTREGARIGLSRRPSAPGSVRETPADTRRRSARPAVAFLSRRWRTTFPRQGCVYCETDCV